LPGITGLLEYSQETAQPIRDLTSTYFAATIPYHKAKESLLPPSFHTEMVVYFVLMPIPLPQICYLETETCEIMKEDIDQMPVSDKMKALLKIASLVQISGKAVTPSQLD
jgi:hypothetical protein